MHQGGVPLRKKALIFISWLHRAILTAYLIPVIYALFVDVEQQTAKMLYMRSFLIMIPIAVFDVFSRKIKNNYSYFFAGLPVLILMALAAWLVGPYSNKNDLYLGYTVFFSLETAVFLIFHFTRRLKWREEFVTEWQDRQEHTAYAAFLLERRAFAEQPNLYLLVFFPCVYLIGQIFLEPDLCGCAAAGFFCYVILLAFSMYLSKTERYLMLNRKLYGVPKSRIYGVGRAMITVFLILLAAGMLPGIFMSGYRKYGDIRHWSDEMLENSRMEQKTDRKTSQKGPDYEKLGKYVKRNQAPAWMEYLFYLAAAAIACFLAVLSFRGIRELFLQIRRSYDDNEDLVEDIIEKEEKKDSDTALPISIRRREKDRSQGIRKVYRRTIKKHRKDLPGVWESPREIEENAGLLGDPKMEELHEQYERARYAEEMSR